MALRVLFLFPDKMLVTKAVSDSAVNPSLLVREYHMPSRCQEAWRMTSSWSPSTDTVEAPQVRLDSQGNSPETSPGASYSVEVR